MLHKDSTLGSRHAVHNWEVADYAALASLAVVASDKGKMALVGSNKFYMLTNNIGPIWVELTKPATYITFNRTGNVAISVGESAWYPPANCTITSIEAWVGQSPVGSNIVAKLNKNGSVVATLTILDGALTMVDQIVSILLLTTDYLTVDVTEAGATTSGKNLAVRLGMI